MKATHASPIVGLFAMFFASAAPATTATVNYNDLWWDPSESGWGVNMIMQYDTIFATFFIYGPDGKARWYTASDMKSRYLKEYGQPSFR